VLTASSVGLPAIQYYFESEKVILREAKILVIGDGKVGKTSLVWSIRDCKSARLDYLNLFAAKPQLPRPADRTIGIDIYDLSPLEDKEVELHFWDLAGQLEFQPYHQNFFSHRSLNLIVWRVNDLLYKGYSTVSHYIAKWISSIAANTASSMKTHDQANLRSSSRREVFAKDLVILVGNIFSDDRNYGNTETFLKPFLGHVYSFAEASCAQNGLLLVSAHTVDCGTGDGIPALRQTLIRLVREKIALKIPKKFVKLKTSLLESFPPENGFVVCNKAEFSSFTIPCGLKRGTREPLLALQTLHNLGFLFYKPEADLVVLNPRSIPKISGLLVRNFFRKSSSDFIDKRELRLEEILDQESRDRFFKGADMEQLLPDLYQVMLEMGFFFEDRFTGKLFFPFSLKSNAPTSRNLLLVPSDFLESKVYFHSPRIFPSGLFFRIALGINGLTHSKNIKIDTIWQRGLRVSVLRSSAFCFITVGFTDDTIFLRCYSAKDHLRHLKELRSQMVSCLKEALPEDHQMAMRCPTCLFHPSRGLPRFPTEYPLLFRRFSQDPGQEGPGTEVGGSFTSGFLRRRSSLCPRPSPSAHRSYSAGMEVSRGELAGLLHLPSNVNLYCLNCHRTNTRASILEPRPLPEPKMIDFAHTEKPAFGRLLYEIFCPPEDDHLFDVVFIHGLVGDPWRTWTNPDKVFWPKEWLVGDLSRNARIITVGYVTSLTLWAGKDSTPLQERAAEIFENLIRCGVGRRPFFLIGHSMGGLQIKEIISISSHIAQRKLARFFESTVAGEGEDEDPSSPISVAATKEGRTAERERDRKKKKRVGGIRSFHEDRLSELNFLSNCWGICFYSVPHLGSRLAILMSSLGSLTHPSHSIDDLNPGSETLLKLHQEFLEICQEHPFLQRNILNLMETKKMLGIVQVVPLSSSSLPPQFANVPLPCDHDDICIPREKSDPSYSLLLRHLNLWLAQGKSLNHSVSGM